MKEGGDEQEDFFNLFWWHFTTQANELIYKSKQLYEINSGNGSSLVGCWNK